MPVRSTVFFGDQSLTSQESRLLYSNNNDVNGFATLIFPCPLVLNVI